MKKQNSKNYSSKAQSAQPDNTIFVFGHRNPDSDSICSSLVVADWLNATNRPAKPYRLGSLTPESRYILNSAGIAAPDLLDVDLTDKLVWLVDFTDIEQGPSSLINSNIIGIIDHHRIGTVITRNPPDVWVKSSRLLWDYYSVHYDE
ncbi:DHH family phosphoesterase [Pseudomonas aeruginosa]|uniref:DHH family phosphoesterase n=1 Tax=Pseudomonas aeruginosa TaxID=287 RepID=UPI001C7DF719|nr:DHH family phosphoesterase [Pseudomonas aeruginosa]